MNYNINFQIAALIIVVLLLYHFLTQKKLHNADTKAFTYVLVLGSLYILFDFVGTLVAINYTPERESTILLVLTGIYLFDIMIPYILYCCVAVSWGKAQKINVISVLCTGITVVMIFLMVGNIEHGWFFYFDRNYVFRNGSGYFFLYLYALAYAAIVMF